MSIMKFLIGLFLVVGFLQFSAQENPVLMTVNGSEVYKYEFEQIFWKNKKESVATKEDLDEYVDLFTKFKLKVTEAEELGLDTVPKFIKELDGYRVQLQKPYLIDSKVNEALITEAYSRTENEVRASHILLLMKGDVSPEDTLKVYNKIKSIRDEIVKGTISFVDAAVKYSEDESVKNNKGDLGYFTAFRMVYPFESAAFNTKVGDVSQPFRTRFGYHIVKTTNKRKGRGTVKVAHIMLTNKKGATEQDLINSKKKIEEIYQKIQKGASFEKMALEFSEDRQSAAKGGELKWIKPGETFVEFDSIAFSLKENGVISSPVMTPAGWHIIKQIDVKPVGDLSSMRSELKSKIQRDTRSQISKESFINKLKAEYGYTAKTKSLKKLSATMDSSIYAGKWKYKSNKNMLKEVAAFADQTITLEDVAKFIEKTQRPMREKNIEGMVQKKFDALITSKIMDYEKSQLERKHPEYKSLLKEYRDGILLFEITDQKVWSKGVKDTVGLKSFYESHKSEYMWSNRTDAKIFSSSKEKVVKEAFKMYNMGSIKTDSIINLLNKDSQLNLKYEEGVLTDSEHEFLKSANWKEGINAIQKIGDKHVFIVVNEKLPSGPKKLNEAKGLITAAYQDSLEKEWISQLREKYKVTINTDVLYTISKKP